MLCKVQLRGHTSVWMNLGGGRVSVVGALGMIKSKMAPFPPLHSFHISPGALIYPLPVIHLEEEKTKARHRCFQYFKGCHVEEEADFLCVSPEGQS